jgi:hypothetical protein
VPRKSKLSVAEQVTQILQQTRTIQTKRGPKEIPLSIRAAAKIIGKDERTLRRWLAGDTTPKPENAKSLQQSASRTRAANIKAAKRSGVKIDPADALIVPRISRVMRRDPLDPKGDLILSDTLLIRVGSKSGGTFLDAYSLRMIVEQYRTARVRGSQLMINGIYYTQISYRIGEEEYDDNGNALLFREATGWEPLTGMKADDLDNWIRGLYRVAETGMVIGVTIKDPRLAVKKPRKRKRK